MGIFKSIGRGVKSGWRDITGKTAAKAAKKAAKRQAGSIMAGYRAQQAQVDPALRELQTYSDIGAGYLQPYRQAGMQSVADLRGMAMGGMPEYAAPTAEQVSRSPAVQFRMEQAQRAAERSASARGGLLGGGHQRQLARYMQGLASQEYGAESTRRMQAAELSQRGRLAQMQALQGIGQMGFTGAREIAGMQERLGQRRAGIRTGSGAAAAAALQSAGQARASGALAGAQARQQGMGNIMRLGGQLGAAYLTGGASLAMPGGMPSMGNPGMSGEMAGEEELPMYGYGYPTMMGGAYG